MNARGETRGAWIRIVALAGVAGPVLFSAVVVVAAALRPGYSHSADFISELGATGTPYAALMNYAGFIPGGLLIAALGVALAGALPRRALGIVGAVLVAVFGSGVAASGVVSCDPGCPQSGGSPENLLHNAIAVVSFLSLIVGAGVLGLHFRRLPRWRHLSFYSLFTSVVAFGFLVALGSSVESGVDTGLWQRLLLTVMFLWCAVMGLAASSASRTLH